MVLINSFCLLLAWYIFILFMLKLVSNKMAINKGNRAVKKLAAISKKNIKSVEEQLYYVKAVDNLYISFPLLLIMITVCALFMRFILSFVPNFIFGLALSIFLSAACAGFMVSFKPTKNGGYYFIVIFLYGLFIAVSILIFKFYPINLYWWLILLCYIGIYFFCKKLLKWNI